METMYIIVNKKNPTYFWSNTFGWVPFHSATFFSYIDKQTLCLPIEGEWKEFSPKKKEKNGC